MWRRHEIGLPGQVSLSLACIKYTLNPEEFANCYVALQEGAVFGHTITAGFI